MNQAVLPFSSSFLELLRKRGFSSSEEIQEFLSPRVENLEDPFKLKGLKEAVTRIHRAVDAREKILIHGDYDVDGITSTSILTRTLKKLGTECSVFLPHRSEDGYGVSEAALKRARGENVSLVITVDCGITAVKEIEAARTLGMDVIVIDHHQISPAGLPPASVIIDPLQLDCPYPFKELSAAGLAFKLAQALIGPQAYEMLDLVALSTISDVAPLVGENRILVKKGLEKLSSRSNQGLRALAQAAGLKAREINVGHVGFVLGPRLNAAGRMSSPEIALRLLTTDHEKEAASLADILNQENKMRQKEERRVLKEAIEEVDKTVNFNREKIIVVGREGWHLGVIGIVASRLAEKYYRPAIVMSWDGEKGQGSGRSIKQVHLFRALEACRDYLEEFGGHEQAAGVTLRRDQVSNFKKALNVHMEENYTSEAFVRKVAYDMELKLEDLKGPFVEELKWLEPHGAGNPRPVFLTRGLNSVGKVEQMGPQTLKFWVRDEYRTYEAIWMNRFGDFDLSRIGRDTAFDLTYSLKFRSWNGIESLTLEVKEIKPRSS
ncbi:MAG: single-stranded-DNA-specific exonuclease RecJ [Candidatus Omnitrophica bacterium]|nr:single-stranded-DNA-specific exonuclease RecJ [Candidatus Omnitrophota bacterium]